VSESIESKLYKLGCNLFPAIRRSNVRVTYVSKDFSKLSVRLPLTWKTCNIHGAIMGGNLYAAVDPFYVGLFQKRLGKGYVAWDKESNIKFKKPGKKTLYTTFEVSDNDIIEIKRRFETRDKVEQSYNIDLVDTNGTVYAEKNNAATESIRKNRQDYWVHNPH